jgi:hypothetical protein
MPATPFEYAWRPLQRLKVSLISVSFTAKVQGSKMWQITGKWLLGNNHRLVNHESAQPVQFAGHRYMASSFPIMDTRV